MAQILQRMRLTWLGGLVDNSIAVKSFTTVLVLVICYTIFDYALYNYLFYNLDAEYSYIVEYVKYFGGFCYAIWFLVTKTRARRNIRETYAIPEEQCVGCEDVVLSAFCSCCTGTNCVIVYQCFLPPFSFLLFSLTRSYPNGKAYWRVWKVSCYIQFYWLT